MTNEFHSHLNYPDPFKPTGIEFMLPENAVITITIFNRNGEEIYSPVENKAFAQGQHKILLNLETLHSGEYMYRITAIGKTQTYTETKRLK